jgi:hypothetical protein
MKYIPYTKIAKFRENNTPDKCPIFECSLEDPVLDHNHNTGMVRGVLNRQSNSWLGKIENSWKRFGSCSTVNLNQALKNVCKYLDKGDLNYLHPRGAKQLMSRFSRYSKEKQIEMLVDIKCTKKQINSCQTSDERSLLYRTKLVKTKYK